MEDEKLVRRLQKGSRTALEQAINRYTAYVSTIVWRTLGAAATREDTEEVVSAVQPGRRLPPQDQAHRASAGG